MESTEEEGDRKKQELGKKIYEVRIEVKIRGHEQGTEPKSILQSTRAELIKDLKLWKDFMYLMHKEDGKKQRHLKLILLFKSKVKDCYLYWAGFQIGHPNLKRLGAAYQCPDCFKEPIKCSRSTHHHNTVCPNAKKIVSFAKFLHAEIEK
mmetsp:Transcript_24418/g.36626  ORF Transcript_24418/g.36626 Transcript_24418/m.36626 type:complete len:150 (+) Transcript_24418:232-681(+)